MWKFKFEKEFRRDNPQTIGETDKEFDLYNYKDWLEEKLTESRALNNFTLEQMFTEYAQTRDPQLAVAIADKLNLNIKHFVYDKLKECC